MLDFRIVFSMAALLGFVGCGVDRRAVSNEEISLNSSGQEYGIIGGKSLQAKDILSHRIVAVYDQDAKALCTGSVVGLRVILTAAHCVGNDPRSLKVVFDVDVKKHREIREVVSVEINPNWSKHRGSEKDTGDVAMLLLNQEIPKGYEVNEILSDESMLKDELKVVLAGYGITRPDSQKGAGRLRKTSAKIKNVSFSSTEVEIDQTGKHGACHGDSGGPAFILNKGHFYLWGVTSRGSSGEEDELFSSTECLVDSIYTKISAYKAWFDRVLAKWRN